MKKYPKVVQCDKRGQIIIPKDIRQELKIEEGSAFWVYTVTDEGILLKKINLDSLSPDDPIIKELKEKSEKINVKTKNMDETVKRYKKIKEGKLDLI